MFDLILFFTAVFLTTDFIRNFKAKHLRRKPGQSIEEDVWQQLIDIAQERNSSFSVNSNDFTVKHVLFSTPHMQKLYHQYHEVLFIDTTYNLNNFKFPVVVFMITDEDNNSQL